MTLFLLCAGEGTRFRPHTLQTPKPALPFLGVPLAHYSLEWAKELSPKQLVVNTYHLPEKIHALFQKPVFGSKVLFSDEAPLLRGSGGALSFAASLLKSDPFLVMNGDEVFLPTFPGQLQAALDAHQREDRLATLIVMEHPEVGQKFGGVWTDSKNQVLGFHKKSWPGADRGWHFIGAAIYSKRLLARMHADRVTNILYEDLTQAIQEGESVGIHPVRGAWYETGNEVSYLEATESCLQLLSRQAPESQLLQALLSREFPAWHLDEDKHLLSLRGQQTLSYEIEGFGVLGPQVHLTGSGRLQRVVLHGNIQEKNLRAASALLMIHD